MKKIAFLVVLFAVVFQSGDCLLAYPIWFHENWWTSEWNDEWQGYSNGFRSSIGSISTSSLYFKGELKLEKRWAETRLKASWIYTSDFNERQIPDWQTSRSQYGYYEAEYFGSESFSLLALLVPYYHKKYYAGGPGICYNFSKSHFIKFFLMYSSNAQYMQNLENYFREGDYRRNYVAKYELPPFYLNLIYGLHLFKKFKLDFEDIFFYQQYHVNAEWFFPPLKNQKFRQATNQMKLSVKYELSSKDVIRWVFELDQEWFYPKELQYLDFAVDQHWGQSSPYYSEVKYWRKWNDKILTEIKLFGGFHQLSTLDYWYDRYDEAGGILRFDYFLWKSVAIGGEYFYTYPYGPMTIKYSYSHGLTLTGEVIFRPDFKVRNTLTYFGPGLWRWHLYSFNFLIAF